MTTKKNARRPAGEEGTCRAILARSRAIIKAAVVTLALRNVLPFKAAEWIIRSLRLRGA
jgi:hypothetical protein